MLSAAVAAVLALPAIASANVYCVDVVGGDCTDPSPDPQTALNSAATNPGPDKVRLGPQMYTAASSAGFGYSDFGAPVELIGSGAGLTTLTIPAAPGGGAVVNNSGVAGSSLSDLKVKIPTPIAAEAYQGVGTGNGTYDVTRVRVEAPAVFSGFGVLLQGGGTVDETTIALPNAGVSPGNVGLQSYSNLNLTDSSIFSDTGIKYAATGGTLTVRRSNLHVNGAGISQEQGNIDVGSSLIETNSTGVSVGNPNGFGASESFVATLDGVTIAGKGPGTTTGVLVFTNSNPALPDNHSAVIASSILDQSLDHAVERMADTNGAANVTTTFSNLDPSTNLSTNDADGDNMAPFGTGAITPLGGDVNVASGFMDQVNGDYHLLASSPLLDLGDPTAPAPGALDLDSDARALDASFDCNFVQRRDIGADEFAGALQGVPANCNPVAPTPVIPGTIAPTAQAPAKKCKKKKKRNASAVAAKKCKKKKPS